MKSIAKLILIFLCSIVALKAQADEVEMAWSLRQSGKIYVVVAVIILIFLGFVIYLIMTERRLKKLEDLKNKKQK